MNTHLNTLAATVAARTNTLNTLNVMAQEVCADMDTIGAHVFDTGTAAGVLVTVQLRSEADVRAFAAERGITVEATARDVDWEHVAQIRHINADIAVEGGCLRITACEFVARPAVPASEAESTEAAG